MSAMACKDAESTNLCQNENNIQNETGGRRNECMKSLHALTWSRSVKAITSGSDSSNSDGEMRIADLKHGVFRVEVERRKDQIPKNKLTSAIW
jgi:hypothetical protein